MKFNYLMTAALAMTLGLASCSSDENVGGGQTSNDPASFSLKISQPSTYAADPNATADEVKVSTIDVFIYDGTTFKKHEQLTLTGGDFTVNAVTNDITSTKKIATTVGAKNIYVGLNLPAAVVTKIQSGSPAAAVNEIANVSELKGTNGFAMFSKAVTATTLVADDTDPANTVNVTVSRLLNKIIVEEAAALGTAITGGTISDLKFAVSNINKKFFALPDLLTYKDPNWDNTTTQATDFYKAAAADYVAVNANGTAANAANAVYAMENTSDANIQNQRTYASVRGVFLPSSIVKLTTPGDGTSALIADAAITAGTTFHVVTVAGVKNYFSSLADATDYSGANAGSKLETYTDGKAYYNVWLNPTPAAPLKKFDILRNNVYKVVITKINGLGEPGDIDGGTDPVDEPTNITVNATIELWTMNSQDSELNGH